MGTWNTSSFDNDDAQDWLADLEESEDTGMITGALTAVTENEEYVEAPEAQQAVAAAELIAAMRGYPAADVPDEAASWSKRHGRPDDGLTELARRAVVRVQTDSELKELWDEGDPSEWNAMMSDLAARLVR